MERTSEHEAAAHVDPGESEHAAAERSMRELIDEAGLPQPDDVEHRERSVLMLWHKTKLAVFIDLDDDGDAPQT